GPNGRLATRARPADAHIHRSEAYFFRLGSSRHGSLLRGERRALPRPAEAERTGARPGNGVSFRVGYSHNSVVESGLHVNRSRVDDSLLLLLEGLLLAGLRAAFRGFGGFRRCFRHYVFPVGFFLFATLPG